MAIGLTPDSLTSWVSKWQGHLLSCPGQLKTKTNTKNLFWYRKGIWNVYEESLRSIIRFIWVWQKGGHLEHHTVESIIIKISYNLFFVSFAGLWLYSIDELNRISQTTQKVTLLNINWAIYLLPRQWRNLKEIFWKLWLQCKLCALLGPRALQVNCCPAFNPF